MPNNNHGLQVNDKVRTSGPHEDHGVGTVARVDPDGWICVRQASTSTFPTNHMYHYSMLALLQRDDERCETCGQQLPPAAQVA